MAFIASVQPKIDDFPIKHGEKKTLKNRVKTA